MKKLFTTLALCLFTVILFAQNKRIMLKDGQELKMKIDAEQNMTMGMGMEMKSNSVMYGTFKVQGITDSGYTVSSVIDRAVIDFDMMGQKKVVDSDKKEDMESQEGAVFNAMINRKKIFSINAYTGVVAETDTEADVEDAADESSAMGMGNLSESSSKTMQSLIFLIPAKAKPGTQWADSSNDGKMASKNMYTLKSIEKDIATVDFVSTALGTASVDMQGQNIDVTTDSKTTGTMEVNTKTGLCQSNTSVVDSQSTMDVMGQSMDMGMKMKNKITIQ